MSRESFTLKTTLNVIWNLGQIMQEVERCLEPKEGQRHISTLSEVIFEREGGREAPIYDSDK